jgi:hypothetical protein
MRKSCTLSAGAVAVVSSADGGLAVIGFREYASFPFPGTPASASAAPSVKLQSSGFPDPSYKYTEKAPGNPAAMK